MRAPGSVCTALLLLGACGCAPSTVDYSTLRSAAQARQRRAGLDAADLGKDVRVLMSRPLSAESAAQVALLNNRGLKASVEEVNIARAALRAAHALPNPALGAALRFDGTGTPEIELGAMLNLADLLLLLPRGAAAAAGVEVAQLEAVGAVLDLAFDARRDFYEYQAALQALELHQGTTRAHVAAAEAATRLREAGNITELELANQQGASEEAQLQAERAAALLLAARERLNATLGLSGRGLKWRAPASLPALPARELPLPELEDRALRQSLDLAIAKQRFAVAAKQADNAAASGWLPELRAGVVAERADQWSLGPAVEVELPLFYQAQGELGEARAQQRQATDQFADTSVRIRASARTLAARLNAARLAAVRYREVVLPLKRKIVAETQLQYNAMLVGVFQLLQAKREEIEAEVAAVDALREYWITRTDVQQLLSGRLTTAERLSP